MVGNNATLYGSESVIFYALKHTNKKQARQQASQIKIFHKLFKMKRSKTDMDLSKIDINHVKSIQKSG